MTNLKSTAVSRQAADSVNSTYTLVRIGKHLQMNCQRK